ncbi:hypothetical protein QQP08_021731 [Theobroma cacao]|nr:hypothetical protein QQP08_021731 [Theobroma cacao]
MLKQVSLIFLVLFACYMGVHSQKLKHLTNELEVKVPASKVWELYRHLGISKLAADQLKNVIQSIKVLKGHGGVGTVLKLTFVPVQIVRFDIIEKSKTSSIIKSDISYAVKKVFEAKDPKPNIQLLAAAAQIAKKFLESKQNA